MMRLLYICFALIFGLSSYSQEVKFEITDSIPGSYTNFSVDNFGRIYLSNEDVLIQFSKELDTLFTSSLKTIRPTSIESSKSFRTLLFDQERSIIQFLDNTLTDIQGDVDLVGLDIQQPVIVCESFGGNTIWILDADGFRLVKLNEKLEKVLITENLTAVFDGGEMPTQMVESNDYLYVLIPEKGVAIFDVFGTFISIYPTSAKWIDAMDSYLFVQSENQLEIISTEGIMDPEFTYEIPAEVIKFRYARERVYFLTPDGLLIGNYKLKK